MIIWLNLLAFGGLEAVFLWPLVLGLYWERANAAGALSAMIVGGVLYAVLATLNIQYLAFIRLCLAAAKFVSLCGREPFWSPGAAGCFPFC